MSPEIYLSANASPAPEPASWLLMLLGFAILGLVLRASVRKARRQFYLNCGLTESEAKQALDMRGSSLRSHVEEMRRRRL